MPKSWLEKFYAKQGELPKITVFETKKTGRKVKMLIPSPEMIYEIMARVPAGRLITVSSITGFLAQKFSVDKTCPLTTGIFIWIAANASVEMVQKGIKDKEIPWWRTLKSKGELVKRYPGGLDRHKALLEAEGFPLIKKKDSYFVSPLEPYLWDFRSISLPF